MVRVAEDQLFKAKEEISALRDDLQQAERSLRQVKSEKSKLSTKLSEMQIKLQVFDLKQESTEMDDEGLEKLHQQLQEYSLANVSLERDKRMLEQELVRFQSLRKENDYLDTQITSLTVELGKMTRERDTAKSQVLFLPRCLNIGLLISATLKLII